MLGSDNVPGDFERGSGCGFGFVVAAVYGNRCENGFGGGVFIFNGDQRHVEGAGCHVWRHVGLLGPQYTGSIEAAHLSVIKIRGVRLAAAAAAFACAAAHIAQDPDGQGCIAGSAGFSAEIADQAVEGFARQSHLGGHFFR